MKGLGYNNAGGAAAFQIGRIYMISLCVEMNGHLNLGLCVWSKFFVGISFKHSFLAVTKTSFALTCLYLIFGLMGKKKKKNYQKIINNNNNKNQPRMARGKIVPVPRPSTDTHVLCGCR